ncbi:MAG TPA: 6-bladed beta-propeller [Roseivirga sp.]
MLSCSSGNKESSEQIPTRNIDEFTTYKLEEVANSGKWSDLISEIEITRLEETDETLLSYVFNLHHLGDKVVFTSGDENDIYTFSRTGEFIQKFNKKGGGPEEYENITDLWIEGDNVAIYSRGKFIKRYTLKGDFVSTEKLTHQAGHILKYTEGYALDMFFSAIDDSLFYNVATLNPQLERTGLLQKSKPPSGFNIFTSNSTLTDYKSTFLYHRIMSDTVFIKNENEMTPLIHFDLGSEWFWNTNDGKAELLDKMFNSESVWNLSTKISPQYAYVLGFAGKGEGRNYLIDRIANKSFEIFNSSNEEEKYSLRVSKITDNGIIGSMSSLEVANLLAELEDNQWSFTEGTTLAEIESSENPVLIKVKLKESSDW